MYEQTADSFTCGRALCDLPRVDADFCDTHVDHTGGGVSDFRRVGNRALHEIHTRNPKYYVAASSIALKIFTP